MPTTQTAGGTRTSDEAADTARPGEILMRPLGATGERVPILGMGTGPGGMGLENRDAIRLYHRALDLGVSYIDTAPGYQRAQEQLGEVMKTRREDAFLVTKTNASEGKEARRILEASLKTLNTDHVDLTFVHSLGNKDVDAVIDDGGSLAALRAAQEEGLTRFVGFTSHNAPRKSQKLLLSAPVDAIMVALNFADRFTYNFENEVLPYAADNGVGVAAMKVFGGARGMKYDKPVHSALAEEGIENLELAMGYALGLPAVAVAVIGMFSESELIQNIAWAKACSPLTETQILEVESEGETIASKLGTHFGAIE